MKTAEAKQVDGHPEVVLKNEQGKVVAKVPNGEKVEVLQDLNENLRVRWGTYEGYAKKTNLKLGGDGHSYCDQPGLGRSVTAPARSLSGLSAGGSLRQPAPDFGVPDPDRCLNFENGFTPQRNAAHPATGDHGAVYKAKQVDGHNEVVLKDDSGKILAKVPNGEIVEIREDPGRGDVKVGWKHHEGWAKKTNIIPGHLFDQYAGASTGQYAGASTGDIMDISTGVETAVAKQAEGHDEVVLKDEQGRNCAKVPNGDVVFILSRDAEIVKVRWKTVEGWAKAQNFQWDTMQSAIMPPMHSGHPPQNSFSATKATPGQSAMSALQAAKPFWQIHQDGQWQAMAQNDSDALEAVYNSNQFAIVNLNLAPRGRTYEVNLAHMKMTDSETKNVISLNRAGDVP